MLTCTPTTYAHCNTRTCTHQLFTHHTQSALWSTGAMWSLLRWSWECGCSWQSSTHSSTLLCCCCFSCLQLPSSASLSRLPLTSSIAERSRTPSGIEMLADKPWTMMHRWQTLNSHLLCWKSHEENLYDAIMTFIKDILLALFAGHSQIWSYGCEENRDDFSSHLQGKIWEQVFHYLSANTVNTIQRSTPNKFFAYLIKVNITLCIFTVVSQSFTEWTPKF